MAFNQQIADAVCTLLAEGKSLRAACREVEGAKIQTILDWTVAEGAFAGQYAQARARAYAMLADEIVEISDETEVAATYKDEAVTLGLDATAVARNRLRVDTRKWMLSKMLPKVYGDKVALTGDGGGPIQQETTLTISPQEAYQRMASG